MLHTAFIGEVAGMIALAAFAYYAYDAYTGPTRPNLASWIVWTVLGGSLLWTYRSAAGAAAEEAIWVPWVQFIGPLVVLGVVLKRSSIDWTWLDTFCALGAAASLCVLWFGHTLVAVFAAIACDFCGAVPTVGKAYKHPDTENEFAWGLSCSASVLNLGALERWDIETLSYPMWLVLLTGTISSILVYRNHRNKK